MNVVNPRRREIAEFPDYRVSEMGEVESLRFRGRTRPVPELVIPFLSPNGRWCVKLMEGGKQHTRALAGLVLLTFKGSRRSDEGDEVVFKDQNEHNLDLTNLAWKKIYARPKQRNSR